MNVSISEPYNFQVRSKREERRLFKGLMREGFSVESQEILGLYVVSAVDVSNSGNVEERIERATAGLRRVRQL